MKIFRHFALGLGILFLLSKSYAQAENLTRKQYILKYKDIAIMEMKLSGIPASITLAQACLESGNGNSRLAREGNNHFGIKCHKWRGKTIFQDDDLKNECFRKYNNPEESFRDHSDFLRYRDRYAFLFNLDSKDYKGWAYGLKKAGYATDPLYAKSLIEIIEEYGLYKYDNDIPESIIPPSPSSAEVSIKVIPLKGDPLYTISLEREIMSRNGVRYIVANGYESYSALAKEYNLFTRELLRFNDLKEDTPITKGTVIYLELKKKQSAKHLDRHVIEKGETMYSLSQRYGIRLKYLYKYNKISYASEPEEGDIINLKKL